MKKIEAVIKPFKIDEVKEALEKVGVRGITISEAKGLGRQRGFTEVNTGVEYGDFLPKIRIEIILQDELVDKAVPISFLIFSAVLSPIIKLYSFLI